MTVTNAATLDLANHDLIIRSGDVNAISNLLYNGFDSGDWLGTAGSANITSSTAANDPKGVTGIGVMPADFYINDLGNDVGDGTVLFDGTVVHSGDVLVHYGYYGDLDMDGQITTNDYYYINYARAAPLERVLEWRHRL